MRVFLFIALAFLLAACVPALGTTIEREGSTVVVETTTAQDVFGLRYTILDATTDDDRCLQVGEDLTCDIGDVPADTTVRVVVLGPVGEVGCIARFFLDAGKSAGSLRILPCQARGV